MSRVAGLRVMVRACIVLASTSSLGAEAGADGYARISLTTFPSTSVRRKSRPAWR
jgi:hypothetical protein